MALPPDERLWIDGPADIFGVQPFANYTTENPADDGRDPEQPQRLQGGGAAKHRRGGRARGIEGSVGYGNRDQVKEHERQADGDRREPGGRTWRRHADDH